ncbi:hypothetical protein CHISP_1932 [Chitinispirillum alkaliphilum]|nr:hypothetical protein CHISP_1932 [Chitinispirillum alkaliphilum]
MLYSQRALNVICLPEKPYGNSLVLLTGIDDIDESSEDIVFKAQLHLFFANSDV